jgi:hypothetical protein
MLRFLNYLFIRFLPCLVWCAVILKSGSIFSQQSFDLSLDWQSSMSVVVNGSTLFQPQILGQKNEIGCLTYTFSQQVKYSNADVSFNIVDEEIAPKDDIAFLNAMNCEIPDSVSYQLKVTSARNDNYLVFSMNPYFWSNGVVKRITKIRIEVIPKSTSINEKSFVTNSVLRQGTGDWYKIKVSQDGIFKIDYAFLQSCGIQTAGLNPQHIHIYGNGDGRLPELNSLPRTDDLAKNAIYVSGEGDGSFDAGDYILFYGWGPHRWYANGTAEFEQNRNIYTESSYYFININAAEPASRIQTEVPVGGSSNVSVTSYSYFDLHEEDLVNLVKGGQRWYGELFDVELERTFTFSVPGIVSSTPARFKTAVATDARVSAGSLQQYSVNGTVLAQSSLPSTSEDFVQSTSNMTMSNPPATLPFKISITQNSPSMQVYLDRILLNCRRSLSFTGTQMNFRDLATVGAGNVAAFSVSSFPSQGFVWDVTDRHAPRKISGTFSGGSYQFIAQTDSLREFVASNNALFLTPQFVSPVSAQNLHALPQADYLIVTNAQFINQAERLADLHRSTGLEVHVVTTEQIYHEFSSGMPDPTAIRMFAKMFYDRGATDPSTRPKYLLLFGDGTYDPKNRVENNNNYVITYQFPNGENHAASLVTDDYFGLLSDNDAISAVDMMDIGVGRLLISDEQMAKQQVDKIEHYLKNGSSIYSENSSCSTAGETSTFGDWRQNYIQIADDEEDGYFVKYDCEPQYEYVKLHHNEMNCDKLYLDAYPQQTSAGGQRYPDVFEGITKRVERGALIVNYVGHGGETGLAQERVVSVPQIQEWKNINRLNVFVSATCEFTRFDDPERVSAGEWVSLNPYGGSIALMTTTRSVFFGVNSSTGDAFFDNVFERDSDSLPKSLGEIMRLTKNAAIQNDNKRSFILIGDPALHIALPHLKVVTDSINGVSPALAMDTLRALSKVTIKGHLEDYNGNVLTGFDGVLSPSIFDKIKEIQTLGQDPDSPVLDFEVQRSIIYKGKATVTDGRFSFSFIVPKDINYSFGAGKISYYANSSSDDAGGFDTRLVVGGINPNGISDNQGPDIDLFLNEEQFVNGGTTNQTPVLMANLFDENGINTVGNGIGHDLVAILDGDLENPIVLNDYYAANLDSYQSGKLRFNMSELSIGKHTLTLKVWDVNNNLSQSSIEFYVQPDQTVALNHVLNYPNPFTTHTEFFFEHNQVCTELDVQIQVMTVSGKLVRSINQMVKTEGFRSQGIPWDGRDDFGDQLAKGVYIYTIKVRTPDGTIADKTEKLVLLR